MRQLTLHDGKMLRGDDLRKLVEQARVMKAAIQALNRKVGHQAIVEQAAIAGALASASPPMPNRRRKPRPMSPSGSIRSAGNERGWKGEPRKGGMLFSRTRHGVPSRFTLDADTLRAAEARRLDGMTADLQAWFPGAGKLTIKDKITTIAGPVALVDADDGTRPRRA